MKEHPIIFSTEMVKAILAGKKTMTRRVIKPQPKIVHALYPDATIETEQLFENIERLKCPYGQVGSVLWVRETWDSAHDNVTGTAIFYKADFNDTVPKGDFTWHPSILMPRWASRIILEITNIRVERLNQISVEDIKAEGTPPFGVCPVNTAMLLTGTNNLDDLQHALSRSMFQDLWDSINAKRGYSWESNCWVWVIEFKRIGE